MSNDSFDLAVLGGGPGGYVAAMRAAQLGLRVAIVDEHAKFGGTCLRIGCIPSKALLESSHLFLETRSHLSEHGISASNVGLDLSVMLRRKEKIVDTLTSGINMLLKKNKIEVVGGFASFEGPHNVRITPNAGAGYNLTAKVFVIATGSRPRRPTEIPFDGWRVVDSDEILRLESVPKHMLIYGAGVIGCEYACIFSALGVETLLADSRDRLMQQLDFEVVKELEKSMTEMGVKFRLGQELKTITPKGPKVSVQMTNETIETDVLFFAAGRLSNSDNMGLDKLKIHVSDRGVIKVNTAFQTNLPHIYAAGDVVGSPALAATSTQQGRFCALHAFAEQHNEFPKFFPVGVYTIPELSSVGPTEEQLKESGVDFVVGRAGYGELARGYIRGDNHGLLKLLVDRKTHKILGIHIVGDGAANLVHIGLAFMIKDGIANDLINMIFNYPTLAEAYRIAAFNALNKIFPSGKITLPQIETGIKVPA